MAEGVYVLCAVTSLACTILLFRGYRSSHEKLLLWTGLCFAGLALNNILLMVDLVLVSALDFAAFRSATALAAMMVLLFGLIWERP